MLFGFLFASSISYTQAFIYMGIAICLVALIILGTRFQRLPAADKDPDPDSGEQDMIDIFDPEASTTTLMGSGIPAVAR